MRQRLPAAVNGVPRTVAVFTVLTLVLVAVDCVVYFRYLSAHLLSSAAWCVLDLGLLVALVVWRQRWAWWLWLLIELGYVISPTWGARFRPITDAIELVFIGLLLTPSMRAYVQASRRSRGTQRPQRWVPWLVCLCVTGAVVLPIAVDPRHPSHRAVVYRVIAYVVVWLALAGVLRVAVAIVQKLSHLGRLHEPD
jgi:hypothetical protein